MLSHRLQPALIWMSLLGSPKFARQHYKGVSIRSMLEVLSSWRYRVAACSAINNLRQ